MSSPASKRKRNAASSAAEANAPADEVTGASPAANTRHSKKHTTSIDTTSTPPSKRARTRSSASKLDKTPSHANGSATVSDTRTEKEDPGESFSTTEDSAEIEDTKSHKRRASRTASTLKGQDDAETIDPREREPGTEGGRTMKDPPKGKIVHPRGGYRTNSPPEGRPVRVYADGVFDLFHLGHMRQLEQAKNAFPNTYLIVGVTGDAETHRRKGLTVLSGAERAETVRHCKWVDEVLPNCPWIVTAEFLNDHQIDYVAHDDEPYGADEGDDIYGPIKSQGKFLVTQRTEGVSTTGIITKIVKDYEKYIARQLKRGTSRKELNVSWIKKNELDIKRHVAELRDNIKNNWNSAGGEIGRDFRTLWQNSGVPGLSRPTSPAPSRMESTGGASLAPKSPIFENMKHLEIPGSSGSRMDSPGRFSRSEDFAAGYSLGLVGSIKSWMQRSRALGLRDSSQNASPQESEEEGSIRSPVSDAGDSKQSPVFNTLRGRKSTRSLKSQKSVDAMDVLH